MITADVWKGVLAISVIAGSVIAVESRYQSVAHANEQYQLLASEQEVGKLETELKLIDLELKSLRAIRENRAWTEEESAREEYLKQRRVIIEARLLETTKAA